MRRLCILAMITTVGCVGACETPRWGQGDDTEVADMSPGEAATSRVRAIEELRERRLSETIEVVAGEPSRVAAEGLPEAVQQEWALLRQGLFGGAEVHLDAGDEKWRELAAFDRQSGKVVFRGNPQLKGEGAIALSMAVNEALELAAFEALFEPTSVDEWLTREIVRVAGPVFVSTLIAAEDHELNVSAGELALRPELSPFVDVVGSRLQERGFEQREGAEHFGPALRRSVLREGLATGAALYRAGGWSGLEWGRIEPARSTSYAVRPDRWLGGDGHGQWRWPERFEAHRSEMGWQKEHEGVIGPVMAALWLEAVVDSRAARTIYSGFLTDTFRVYKNEAGTTSFHWVSAWQSPHEAQEIATAAEEALGHYFGSEQRNRRFRVAVQGVNVALATYSADYDPEILNQEVELLTEAGFGIVPEEAAPISFVPTLFEEYVAVTETATLDETAWVDPAAGWTVNVEPLRSWGLQKSDEAHVRWFAIHADSTMVQWTTELLNPLQPEFGSEAYLRQLKQAFAESVSAKEPPHVVVKSEPVEPLIEVDVMGLIDRRPLALKAWQWRRGDVLVTFSVQGPEASFGDRLSEVEAVLESLEEHGEVLGPGRRAGSARDDEGIIEFQIED